MGKDFLLSNKTALDLFFSIAEKQPIIDFHNHLNSKEIYEDPCFSNMTEVWLSGDHYKWRAMRANGIPEDLITGDGDPFEKFLAWADTVQNLIGNPLYHWTHMELQRYFGIYKTLNTSTAKEIWELCNEKLQKKEYSVRNLLRMQHVAVLCTTDDPVDSLIWHEKLKADDFEIQVLPSFRPEKAFAIEKTDFLEYIRNLEMVSGMTIKKFVDLLAALENRLDYFVKKGCKVSDHSLENLFFEKTNAEEVECIFQKRMSGDRLSEKEIAKYHGFLYLQLGGLYKKKDLVMQLHIGALRNNSSKNYRRLGADSGFDSMHDFSYAEQLSGLIGKMEEKDSLPKTIFYCLNPRDMEMVASMAGNFCGNEEKIKGKTQLGAAWWLCDHKRGIEKQLEVVASLGLLSTSVGMLTDSRSFLSFPRHEYYRRILCNKIGEWVENGEYPLEQGYLENLVENICGRNAMEYFGFNKE